MASRGRHIDRPVRFYTYTYGFLSSLQVIVFAFFVGLFNRLLITLSGLLSIYRLSVASPISRKHSNTSGLVIVPLWVQRSTTGLSGYDLVFSADSWSVRMTKNGAQLMPKGIVLN